MLFLFYVHFLGTRRAALLRRRLLWLAVWVSLGVDPAGSFGQREQSLCHQLVRRRGCLRVRRWAAARVRACAIVSTSGMLFAFILAAEIARDLHQCLRVAALWPQTFADSFTGRSIRLAAIAGQAQQRARPAVENQDAFAVLRHLCLRLLSAEASVVLFLPLYLPDGAGRALASPADHRHPCLLWRVACVLVLQLCGASRGPLRTPAT